MALLIQILVSLLIILSLILTINIPVVLATPGEWETSKNNIFNQILIFIFIILLVIYFL